MSLQLPAILMLAVLAACTPLSGPGAPSATGKSADAAAAESEVLQRYLESRDQAAPESGERRTLVAVLPMADESGFRKGIWDLPTVMADLVTEKMAIHPNWEMIPHDVVAAAMRELDPKEHGEAVNCGLVLGADVVVRGTIHEFNMGRFSAGDPLLGGYKSYTGIADLTAVALRVSDGTVAGRATGRSELVDRDLGLDLLGKPREQDVQFSGLAEIPFGSEDFRATILGRATLAAVDELVSGLSTALEPAALSLDGDAPQVLSLDGKEVYVNVGSENGVHAGYRFTVVQGPGPTQVDENRGNSSVVLVEVTEVIGARLSRARVLEGMQRIQVGDRLELQKGGGDNTAE